MAGPGICVLCLADTCTSEVHPVFNPVAPYGYLLSDMYLFMADITNPDFLVLSCRTWIGLDITRFCEQQRQPSSGSAWPTCPKNGKSGPHCWGRGGSTQFAQQLEFAVTAPPLVGCVVWSLVNTGGVFLPWQNYLQPCLCGLPILYWCSTLSSVWPLVPYRPVAGVSSVMQDGTPIKV